MQYYTVEEAKRRWKWSLFGVFGGHRFYLGDYTGGILMILTLGVWGLWALLDYARLPRLVELKNREIWEAEQDRLAAEAEMAQEQPQPAIVATVEHVVDEGPLEAFPSRYAGVCAVCGHPIQQGHLIYARQGWGACHQQCGQQAGWVGHG